MSIDAVLARMKRQDESPWGRVQTLGHRCLTRIEQNRLVQAYGRLSRSRRRPMALRSDPAIDVDVSFFVSLFLHLLLLLLISWFTLSSSSLDRPGPIRVRVLDLGKSPQPQKQTVTKPKRQEKPPAKPAPKPPPPLPAPKVLARSPVKPTRLPHESAEALVRPPHARVEARNDAGVDVGNDYSGTSGGDRKGTAQSTERTPRRGRQAFHQRLAISPEQSRFRPLS